MGEFQSFSALLGPKQAGAPAVAVPPPQPVAKMPPPPPPAQIAQPAPPPPLPAAGPRAGPSMPQLTSDPQVQHVLSGFLGEFVRLRARALEIFEVECEGMLGALAADVLGRELQIAPVDMLQIMRRLRSQYSGAFKIRVAPQDQKIFSEHYEVEPDPTLVPGDIVLETPQGTIDMKLGSRVHAVLAQRRVEV
jgi:hypothetical protein